MASNVSSFTSAADLASESDSPSGRRSTGMPGYACGIAMEVILSKLLSSSLSTRGRPECLRARAAWTDGARRDRDRRSRDGFDSPSVSEIPSLLLGERLDVGNGLLDGLAVPAIGGGVEGDSQLVDELGNGMSWGFALGMDLGKITVVGVRAVDSVAVAGTVGHDDSAPVCSHRVGLAVEESRSEEIVIRMASAPSDFLMHRVCRVSRIGGGGEGGSVTQRLAPPTDALCRGHTLRVAAPVP